MYHVEYGNRYGVSMFNTSDIKYIIQLSEYLEKLGSYSLRLYTFEGEGYKRVTLAEIVEGVTA